MRTEVTLADKEAFAPANLAKYKAVVFLSTTGNVLPTESQRAAMEGYGLGRSVPRRRVPQLHSEYQCGGEGIAEATLV